MDIRQIGAVTLLGLALLPLGCKQRSASSSEAKQIFRDDVPGSGGKGQRWSGLDPKNYPFIISMLGCTGFILDRDAGIAMTAYHCNPLVGAPICQGAPSTPEKPVGQGRVQDPRCHLEGRIREIVEESHTSELDYTIFEFELVDPRRKDELADIKLLADSAVFDQLRKSGQWIHLTGYPGDEYAQQKLTQSTCRIRSELTVSEYAKHRLKEWAQLVKAWEERPEFQEDPVEYKKMRDCYMRVAARNLQRFHYDCSVYGGNSGGPIYYEDQLTGEQVVIGLPSTYVAAPSAKASLARKSATCYELYRDKYIVPILGSQASGYGLVDGDWNSLDRDGPVSSFPNAIPMHQIVAQSGFLRVYLGGSLKQSTVDEVNRVLDDIAAPDQDVELIIDDILKGL